MRHCKLNYCIIVQYYYILYMQRSSFYCRFFFISTNLPWIQMHRPSYFLTDMPSIWKLWAKSNGVFKSCPKDCIFELNAQELKIHKFNVITSGTFFNPRVSELGVCQWENMADATGDAKFIDGKLYIFSFISHLFKIR